MIELLMVMLILTGITAIAIPSMSGSTENVKKVSMINDLRNTVSLLQIEYMNFQEFTTGVGTFVDTDRDGYAENLKNGTKVSVSSDNQIVVTLEDCNGDGTDGDGFNIDITHGTLSKSFNSCLQSQIK